MIYKYIGSGTSNFIGTTYSGVTFSTSVEISGLSGSSLIFKTISRTTSLLVSDDTPVLMSKPIDGFNLSYTLSKSDKTGQIFIYRSYDSLTETPGSLTISAGTQSIRLVGSSVNKSSISTSTDPNLDVNGFGCFFYAFNTWWQY